jgi:N-acetyl-alpha-D-muramate 1-phosphate uridylyltransferase
LSEQNTKIRTAMVLGAGLGKRMRPITDTIPKPLVPVSGKPLIDWGLDCLAEVGVERAVVNVHYLADQLEVHLASRTKPSISISDERDNLLESGGGIVKALPMIGTELFYLINSDTFWLDQDQSNLARLAQFFDAQRMDILLMLASHDQATGHGTSSDFVVSSDGRLTRFANRAPDDTSLGYIYAGAAILHPRIFEGVERDAHSLNREFNTANAAGRLFGLPMTGRWLTVGTPEAIAPAEAIVKAYRNFS